MRNLLPIPVYSSASFSWRNGTGFAFLTDVAGLSPVDSQVFTDAIDTGFEILSERTGDRKLFLFDHNERDAEGDIQESVYVATDARTTVRLAND